MQLIINLLNQFDYCQTPGLVFRLGVDFILPLPQEQQEQQEEKEPSPKYIRRGSARRWIFDTS